MFILQARQVPSNLLKVEMIIYIGKWNVFPDRSQGNKIIIAFRETEPVHLLEAEKSKYVLIPISWRFGAAVKKTMVISFGLSFLGSCDLECK